MKPPEPHRVAVRLIEWAASTLPAAHSGRYQQEFLAELYGLTTSHQLRHAAQVLSRAWVLRAALGEPVLATKGGGTMSLVRRPLTCLLLRRHKWQIVSTEDSSRHFGRCRECGKESRPWYRSPLGRSGYVGPPVTPYIGGGGGA
jgi:hypothetical protein